MGIWYCLRAGTYIYSGYPSDINFWLSGGARYINLWHGTPLKKIERDVATGKYSLRNRYPLVFSLLKPHLVAKPDLLLVASEYEKECFASAFGIDKEATFEAFPPRLTSLSKYRFSKKGKKRILYAPTWRDDHSFRFADHFDLDRLDSFLEKNDFIFLVKLHPSDRNTFTFDTHSHIVSISQYEDIYDLLPTVDLLVTDYSSMIFEALYTSVPVLLFCPDYENYKKKNREFYFDPCSELSIKTSRTQKEFEKELLHLLQNPNGNSFLFSKRFAPYPPVLNLLDSLVKRVHDGL